MGITIKELSERSGVKIPTIRYYERQGLLPESERTVTGQRRYGSVDVARLRFVRFGRRLGMEIDGIRALIEMVGEGNGEEIIVAAEAIGERAEQMQALCARLQAVSAAIIVGMVDEVGVFVRLVDGEGPQVEGAAEQPIAEEPAAMKEAEDRVGSPPGLNVAEDMLPATDQPATEEPATESFIESVALDAPLSQPKRKRTRAKS